MQEAGATDTDEVLDEEIVEETAAEPEQDSETEATAEDSATGDEEVIVTIGDESPTPDDEFDGKPAPAWVKDLRKEAKDKARRIRELEQQLQQQVKPPEAVTLPPKPSLESCDYDAERFEAELESWHEKKRAVDDEKRKAEAEKEAQQKAWQERLTSYETAKKALKVRDFDDAEETVKSLFDVTQQGVIVKYAKNPALFVYATGTNEAKAKQLASIKDPIEFAISMRELEATMKTSTRSTAAPAPERVIKGNAPGAAAALDKQLERLREEAQRTGDFSKVVRYKQQLRQKTP